MNNYTQKRLEEFDEKFSEVFVVYGDVYEVDQREDIKSFISTSIAQAEQEMLKRVNEILQKERDTWAKESIGDKALQSMEVALSSLDLKSSEKAEEIKNKEYGK
jgi:hypothetical protein